MIRAANEYNPHIRHAILRLRGKGDMIFLKDYPGSPRWTAAGQHKLIALTNNFARVEASAEERAFLGWEEGPTPNHLRQLFDDYCDSSNLGMR